jgi:hypothetical protein
LFEADSPDHRWRLAKYIASLPPEKRIPPINDIFRFSFVYDYVNLLEYIDLDYIEDLDGELQRMACAHEIYTDTSRESTRWLLEAYICAGIRSDEIARSTFLSLEVIEAYKIAFFDIDLFLQSDVAFEKFVLENASDEDYDRTAKTIAKRYGFDLYWHLYTIQQSDKAMTHKKEEAMLDITTFRKNRARRGGIAMLDSEMNAGMYNLKEIAVRVVAERDGGKGGLPAEGAGGADFSWMMAGILDTAQGVTQRNIEKRAGAETVAMDKSQSMPAQKHMMSGMYNVWQRHKFAVKKQKDEDK